MSKTPVFSTRARPRLLAGLAANAGPFFLRQRAASAADKPDILGSVRFPFFAFGPESAAGGVDHHLVGNIDLAPTIAEFAGAAAPPMDGRSLISAPARDAILIELLGRDLQTMDWPGDRANVPRYSALRTADHLYVEYQGGARELYDHRRDPHEVQNLLAGAVAPEDAATAAQLSARRAQLRGCRGGTCS